MSEMTWATREKSIFVAFSRHIVFVYEYRDFSILYVTSLDYRFIKKIEEKKIERNYWI